MLLNNVNSPRINVTGSPCGFALKDQHHGLETAYVGHVTRTRVGRDAYHDQLDDHKSCIPLTREDKRGHKVASNLDFVEFIVDQIEDAGEITYKKMFGDYALYSEGKVVALVCDDQLFVKPTVTGKFF